MMWPSTNNVGPLVLVVFLFCFKAGGAEATRPKVTIPQGTLQGVILKTRHSRNIYSFQGIPYAKPPVGDLRFKPPVAAGGWNGTLDAGSDGSPCIQNPNGAGIFGSEDCLYINVYTPKLSTENSKLLPVLVYIPGGAFSWGSNEYTFYNPMYLMDKDILFVSFNYRLGALGFLSTGDEVAPGNWGMKDQVLALKWIQKNIRYFGGDPHQVTLGGLSSGGVSVELHLFSDLSEGLFQKYTAQSGLAISTNQFQINTSKYTLQLGKFLGCPTDDASALLIECLRNRTAEEITAFNTRLLKYEIYPLVTWAPVVEPNIEGAFLTNNPHDLLTKGTIRDIPAIIGWTRDDGFIETGYFYRNSTKFDEFLNDFDNLLPYVLNYHNTLKNASAVTSALKSYYFNNDLTTSRAELLANFTAMAGDHLSRFPSYQIRHHNSSISQPWYLYSFEYHGTISYTDIFSDEALHLDNVCHADELIYLSDLVNSSFFASSKKSMSDIDFKMVDEVFELWTSFVITGVPYSPTLGSSSWPRYSTSGQYLQIGNGSDVSLDIKTSDYKDKMKFWETVTAMLY